MTYRVGDVYAERTYRECYEKVPGSARLQHVPPSLTPSRRTTRSDSISDSTRKAILAHFAKLNPTSPHQRDVMRRRLGPFNYDDRPAFILSDTIEGTFNDFKKQHPEIDISLSQSIQTRAAVESEEGLSLDVHGSN